MKPIYHILGSDIPHHNHTVLSFFQNELLPQLNGQQHFFYVVADRSLLSAYPNLSLSCFDTKKSIAQTVVRKARLDKQAQFILHGQYNFPLWFAILSGNLPASRCYWHIWGADLYEDSKAWKFKMMYPVRRMAQNKLPVLWGTKGDLFFAHQTLQRDPTQDSVLYFPTKMANLQPREIVPNHSQLTVLLGNSGDQSNRHIDALVQIKQHLGDQVRIIIPMGYPANNQHYIEQVRQQAVKLFPENAIEILTEQLNFEDYLALLAKCDAGYFNFERQQGIGTICLLTQLNIPTILCRNNPFTLDMQAENVPFLYSEEVTPAKLAQTQQQLANLDKSTINFFAPNYRTQWLALLTQVSEK
ncbi:TDP-N-acetylfucosamine:lipid II N-acetylfucosaminyltransferase [Actinobacillus equuli]|uniref:TDP-N-acetylfucosamine:lipid II N-acetylfucosaminyltransferase n=1 Tax=Actinobacillus equuli TaxID=718 RepID=UPI002446625B|nr:TDP-N-acetylfucosamine:lipid II N-acetylfucosaminyltransferase [Actinobacillus equuli]WGE83088.1 TDP-N-acetylfucosamine:lipid II N-acetylfucosaminyltransferase [Actinobacillus equuli subsp. equuli]